MQHLVFWHLWLLMGRLCWSKCHVSYFQDFLWVMFHIHQFLSHIHLFYFIVSYLFFIHILFHSWLWGFIPHYASRLYKATASRNRSKVFFYFPVSFIELGSPIEAAPQPGYESSFLEWSSFKPSPRRSRAPGLPSPPQSTAVLSGSLSQCSVKSSKAFAPFCFMGVVI